MQTSNDAILYMRSTKKFFSHIGKKRRRLLWMRKVDMFSMLWRLAKEIVESDKSLSHKKFNPLLEMAEEEALVFVVFFQMASEIETM